MPVDVAVEANEPGPETAESSLYEPPSDSTVFGTRYIGTILVDQHAIELNLVSPNQIERQATKSLRHHLGQQGHQDQLTN